ncbi:MAG: ankyrin repeat domain-containing protein [Proteobacteria bacterium]|nr:ankyrin repeat domain-containing protein [Pseudomonadota bacterium]
MTRHSNTLGRAAVLTVLATVLGAAPGLWTSGWAQLAGAPIGGGGPIGPLQDLNEGRQGSGVKRGPAPALPGARSDPSRVAPMSKLPSEMNPTDALFDAINRGDIATARDAIDRGADLGGRNVLGMTPLELSIDLGRNDISFLLLAQRGADRASAQAQPPAAPSKTAARAKPEREVRSRVVATQKVAAPQAPRTAQLFSGDGGAPVPSAGFLGFGGAPGGN